VARERGETAELPVLELDKTGCRYARTVEEGAVLKSARLLDADVQTERGIRNLSESALVMYRPRVLSNKWHRRRMQKMKMETYKNP
jgi:hypothetical protein